MHGRTGRRKEGREHCAHWDDEGRMTEEMKEGWKEEEKEEKKKQ